VEDSFNHIALDSDVAILALNQPAVNSFYVRPVCYPQASNSFLEEYQLAPGSLGTVVGFGFTENGTLAKELKMTQLPVISASDCADSHGDFFASMTRSTNYCAGYKNGTQVCNGDSGGGQYFRALVRGSTRWYIQGLVSYGVPDSKFGTCSSSQYAIFTRVGRYGDWLVRTLSRENLI
jgi:secreted trypsin-like serine protease